MASFVLPPTIDEVLYPPQVDDDSTIRIWAFSGRRTAWDAARAFLNAGYMYLHSEANPKYFMQRVAFRAIVVRFVNPLDARLLYRRYYHCGSKMVAFTRVNIFTNYVDFFPSGRKIHLVWFNEQQQVKQRKRKREEALGQKEERSSSRRRGSAEGPSSILSKIGRAHV